MFKNPGIIIRECEVFDSPAMLSSRHCISAATLKILRYLLSSVFRNHLPADIIAAGTVEFFLTFLSLNPPFYRFSPVGCFGFFEFKFKLTTEPQQVTIFSKI